jgi:hypothetical protein
MRLSRSNRSHRRSRRSSSRRHRGGSPTSSPTSTPLRVEYGRRSLRKKLADIASVEGLTTSLRDARLDDARMGSIMDDEVPKNLPSPLLKEKKKVEYSSYTKRIMEEYDNNYRAPDGELRRYNDWYKNQILYTEEELNSDKFKKQRHITYVTYYPRGFRVDFKIGDNNQSEYEQCRLKLSGVSNKIYFVEKKETKENRRMIDIMLTIAYDRKHKNINMYTIYDLLNFRFANPKTLEDMYNYKLDL